MLVFSDTFLMLVTLAVAYLLGTIPFGLFLTKLAGLGDIRDIGSGNIGATNVLRTGNKKLALATLLLDAFKGFCAVGLGKVFGAEYGMQLAGLFVVLGHMFPVWLRFKGGKGVATAFGVLFALSGWLGVVTGFSWIVIFFLRRISSLASLVAIALSPIFAFAFTDNESTLLCLVIGMLIFYRHRENIARLIAGTEPAFRKSHA